MNTQPAQIPAANEPAANQEFERTVDTLISTTRKFWSGEELLSLRARIGVGRSGPAELCCDGQVVHEERGER